MKTYLEPEETQQLEDTAIYFRDKLLVRLLFRLGCRVSEAISLKVEDIDFNQGTITIQHLKTRLKLSCSDCNSRLSRTARFCPSCGIEVGQAVAEAREHQKVRTLPIDADTLHMLRDYIDRGGPISKNGQRLLFGIGRRQAYGIIVNCARAVGLPDLMNPETGKLHHVSPHRLRDAFAVHAIKLDDSGDGQRLLQEHLGHASFNSTAKYRKVAGQEQREWYEKLW